ncbi:MAG TPA: hypothetical protein VG737_09925 [Cyclobacteriaceae bacterium]|nr:hypothetical protein [Cyclobacteriaceae bacterium]
MKRLRTLGLLMLMSVATPAAFGASRPHHAAPLTAAEVTAMQERLEQIKAMDVGSLSRPERKAIKQEVKSIKKKMDSSGGIYISVGAVILIVILLILLL